jgi:Uma2 family endonuclease
LHGELSGPFDRGKNGPGGWIILVEPELHLGADIVAPDIAGWRRERMPAVPHAAYFTLPPDWICEVLSSRSTEARDRGEKLPVYARAAVRHAWPVSPQNRTLEVMRLHDGKWLLLGVHAEDERVRAEPFDALELELSALWADVAPPPPGSRASEPHAEWEL